MARDYSGPDYASDPPGRRYTDPPEIQEETYFSQPSTAATPTSAARSSGLISFPFPGAVNVRNVDKILEAIGIAGCVADGKRGISSEVDMLLVNDTISGMNSELRPKSIRRVGYLLLTP